MNENKTSVNNTTRYIGLDNKDINEITKVQLQKIASFYQRRIGFTTHNNHKLDVHIKEYSKTGKKHKWSIAVHLIYPGGTIVSNKANDWDIKCALHKSFQNVENALAHKHRKNTFRRDARHVASFHRVPAVFA